VINKPLTYKLFRDLWQRRGTLLALIFVLAVGVSSYVGMAGVYQALNGARARYYAKYNLANFEMDIKRAPETAVKQLNQEHLPNVLKLRSRIKEYGMANLPFKSYYGIPKPIPAEVLSLPVPRRDLINNVKLYKGRWFSDSYAHEVILDEQFAEARHLVPGDMLTVRLPTKAYKLLVVGTAFSPEFTLLLPPGAVLSPNPADFAVMYAPRKFLQQASDLNSTFNQLLGMTSQSELTPVRNTMTLLADKLDSYGVQLQTAQQNQISVKVLHDELQEVQSITTLFPTMFLIIAAMILNVMITRLVTQQRSAIGTLKALGYSNFELMRHFLSYGIIVGLLGGLGGILFGIWIQHLTLLEYKSYFRIPDMHLVYNAGTFTIGMMISVFSALIGSISGSIHAMKLDPAEAMRPPMPQKTSHLFFETWFPAAWKRMSFRNKMIFRAIFQSRFRSLATLSASILATALVFSSIALLDSVNEMIHFSFDVVQHQDYQMSLRNPLGQDVMTISRSLPGVATAESQLSVPAKIQNGPYLKRLTVKGLPENNHLYTPVDKNYKPIKISGPGLTLSKTLANILHVNVGDQVTFRPLLGERTTTKATVMRIVPTYLGISVYANEQWLSRLLGNSWLTSEVLFKLKPGAKLVDFINRVNQFAPMTNLVNRNASKDLLIKTMNQFMVFFVIMMIIFAGIIAIGAIINTAMISLNERERDVASLRVLGFTKMQVAEIFFGESVVLNTVGIILGLIAGIGFTYYSCISFSSEMYRMPFVLCLNRFIETAALMVIFVLISQGIVYRVIAKMNWFTVLNNRE